VSDRPPLFPPFVFFSPFCHSNGAQSLFCCASPTNGESRQRTLQKPASTALRFFSLFFSRPFLGRSRSSLSLPTRPFLTIGLVPLYKLDLFLSASSFDVRVLNQVLLHSPPPREVQFACIASATVPVRAPPFPFFSHVSSFNRRDPAR